MSEILTCPHGHRWASVSGQEDTVQLKACPVCGVMEGISLTLVEEPGPESFTVDLKHQMPAATIDVGQKTVGFDPLSPAEGTHDPQLTVTSPEAEFQEATVALPAPSEADATTHLDRSPSPKPAAPSVDPTLPTSEEAATAPSEADATTHLDQSPPPKPAVRSVDSTLPSSPEAATSGPLARVVTMDLAGLPLDK